MDERILCVDRTYDFMKSDIYSELFVLNDSEYNYEYTHKFPNSSILNIPEKFQKEVLNFNRHDIEYNNKYQQLVVCLVIRSNSDFLFLDCINGDMKGHTTMVEGHVKYDPLESEMMLNTILYENIMREFNEEIVINFSKIDKKDIGAFYNIKLKYVSWNNDNYNNISYRHIGFIYELDLSDTKYPISKSIFQAGEPDTNKLIFLNLDEIKVSDYNNFDSWTRELIVYNQYINRCNK